MGGGGNNYIRIDGGDEEEALELLEDSRYKVFCTDACFEDDHQVPNSPVRLELEIEEDSRPKSKKKKRLE